MRKLLGIAAVIAATLLTVLVGAGAPADASSGHTITPLNVSFPDQCGNTGCFFYDGDVQGAYWVAPAMYIPNLAGYKFKAGTGDGAGKAVKNDAASIACGDVDYQCVSYYNENYTGNYDTLTWFACGQLFYTWNDEASASFYSS